jgi:hypothetical protein
MKKLMATILVLAFALPSLAIVEDQQVQYVGGTVATVKDGAMGTLDTTQDNGLAFNSPNGNVVIPYARVTRFNYENREARQLGVILYLLVSLVKEPQRQHFIHLSYTDERGVTQNATFEVAKDRPLTLVPIIESRIKRDRQDPQVAHGASAPDQVAAK